MKLSDLFNDLIFMEQKRSDLVAKGQFSLIEKLVDKEMMCIKEMTNYIMDNPKENFYDLKDKVATLIENKKINNTLSGVLRSLTTTFFNSAVQTAGYNKRGLGKLKSSLCSVSA